MRLGFNSIREKESLVKTCTISLSGADSSHFNCYVSSTFQGACEGVPLPWKRSVPTTEFPNSLDNFQPLYIFFLFFFLFSSFIFTEHRNPPLFPFQKLPASMQSHTLD